MSLFCSRRGVLRALVMALAAAAILLSVVTMVSQSPQYVSRQGPWAREHLGQLLPLRLFSSIGGWTSNTTTSTATTVAQSGTDKAKAVASHKYQKEEDTEVRYVKFVAAGQVITEYTDADSVRECTSAEAEDGCLVWASRAAQFLRDSGKDDGKERKEEEAAVEEKWSSLAAARSGVVTARMEGRAADATRSAPLMAMRLVVQEGTAIAAPSRAVRLHAQWNDTDTPARAADGAARWVGFGAIGATGARRLIEIFPTESGQSLNSNRGGGDDNEANNEGAGSRGRYGYGPAVAYFESRLSGTDAVRLFRHLYTRRQEQLNKAASSGKVTTPTNITAADALGPSFSAIFSVQCFWLAEATHPEGGVGSSAGGRAWSTCGDRISWGGDADRFARLARRANYAVLVAVLATGLPVLCGALHQQLWVSNSRTRALRVNPYQLVMSAFMVVLAASSGTLVPVALDARESGKATYLLLALTFAAMGVLFFTFLSVDREFTSYFLSTDTARQDAGRRIISFFFMVWFAPAMLMAAGGLYNPWVAGTVCGLFWLPQALHCFTMDGWTGLTAPFILGNLSIVLAPTLAPLLVPAPWTLPTATAVVAVAGAVLVTAQAAMLLALRLNGGHNLVPNCIAPWRHIYRTTAEAQRLALSENPLCPICRNSLEEGWDDSDELWRTPCNHLFHKSCLERWMQERTECPLCRKLLPEP